MTPPSWHADAVDQWVETQDEPLLLVCDPTDANKIFSPGRCQTPSFLPQPYRTLQLMRATNGGTVRNLDYTLDNIETQITNHKAANGRIIDVDVARESSNLAKQQVLVQSGGQYDCPGKSDQRCGPYAHSWN